MIKHFMKTNLIIAWLFVAILSVYSHFFGTVVTGPVDDAVWILAVVLAGAAMAILDSGTARLFLLLAVASWLVIGAGLVEVLMVAYWAGSAFCLGIVLLRWLDQNRYGSETISFTEPLLLGTAVWLALLGCMVHFPINSNLTYFVLFLLPYLFVAGHISEVSKKIRSEIGKALDWMAAIELPWWVLGIAIIGWVLRWVAFPSLVFDDHALHLRLWTELLTSKFYSFDFHDQVFSVSPFAVDLLHASLSLMAGSDARSAMNLGLAMLLLLGFVRILDGWKLLPRQQLLLLVLMMSTPMFGYLLISLQTELALAAIAIAALSLIYGHGEKRSVAPGVLAAAALCASVKLTGVVLGCTIMAVFAVQTWLQRRNCTRTSVRWASLVIIVVLGVLAFHSYGFAWYKTGNPLFPFYNGVFKSPYFSQENFSDSRWIHGFSITSYVKAFFYTSEFNESANYTAGWQYLFLLPIAALLALRSDVPTTLRLTLVPVAGFGLVMFSATQYWRYMFPVMPLASLLLASFFIPRSKWMPMVARWAMLVCIALNLLLYKGTSGLMASPAGSAFTQDGKNRLREMYAPAAVLTNALNYSRPGAKVLYPSGTPYGATLHGRPIYVNWYSPLRAQSLASSEDVQGLRGFMQREAVDIIVTSLWNTLTSKDPDSLLRDYASQYGTVLIQSLPFTAYEVGLSPVVYRNAFTFLGKSSGPLRVTEEPQEIGSFSVNGETQFRYSAQFSCPTSVGYYVAFIAWDVGVNYYRLVSCDLEDAYFTEAFPIPKGASKGTVIAHLRDTSYVLLKSLKVDLH